MSADIHAQRGLMVRLLRMVEQYERCSFKGPKLMRGLRYQIAVEATDVNGEECMFPACGCPKADCALRPPGAAKVDWNGSPGA